MTEKINFGMTSYIFGIVSIVLAFFIPIGGAIFGIIGFFQSKKDKTELSKRARVLSIIGIVLSICLFIVSILVNLYLANLGINLSSFPA